MRHTGNRIGGSNPSLSATPPPNYSRAGTRKAQSDTLNRLRSLGVRIAVDDFGTGFSSLEYLRSYPINRIKIAQQFMRKIPANANDTAIVEATIALANALKVDIIAEGVETSEQLQFLSAAGCRDIQGYYFSRPVPAKAMAEFLREGKFDVLLAEPEGTAVNGSSPGTVVPTAVISEPLAQVALRKGR